MLNCSFVAVIRPTLFYSGIGQTPCSYEHHLVHKWNKSPSLIVESTSISMFKNRLHDHWNDADIKS